jgi:hypothetical protein
MVPITPDGAELGPVAFRRGTLGLHRRELVVERHVLQQGHAERPVEIEHAADQQIERARLAPLQRRGDTHHAGERGSAEEQHEKERTSDRGDDRLHGADAGGGFDPRQGGEHEGG